MNKTLYTTRDLKIDLRAPYAWPGGYEKFFLTDDCVILCGKCIRENFRNVLDSMKTETRDGWKIESVLCEYGDPESGICTETCGHCNRTIGELS
jgi:hypothetical protein